MLHALRQFIATLSGEPERRALDEDDQRLAAAALLYHVIAVDGMVTAEERTLLADLLMRRFKLDIDAAGALVDRAAAADAEAVDLYGFTSLLKRSLDESEREGIVEAMWKLVYSDGSVHEFEDNVVWRVAELLGVSSQVRIRLKQAARPRHGAADEADA
jgi:uncharacterized tellurite resistance protein B-like protein